MTSEEAALALARIVDLMRQGRWGEVEDACWSLLKAAPNQPLGWFYLGTAMMTRGASKEALPALRQAVSLEAGKAHMWSLLLSAQLAQADYAGAEVSAQRAVALDDANSLHWANLGHVLFQLRRWEEAAAACRWAIGLDAQDVVAWENLAASESMLGRLDDAALAYQRTRELGARTIPVELGLAQVYRKQGRLDRALHVVHELVQRDPSGRTWLEVGYVRQALMDWENAEAAYRRALSFDPREPEALRGVIYSLLRRWEPKEATELAEAYVREMPRAAGAWSVLGACLKMAGRADEACEALRQAATLDPTLERYSGLLLAMQYTSCPPEELKTAHVRWESIGDLASQPRGPRMVNRSPNRALRIGLVSANLGLHPVSFLGLPVFERLDKEACTVVCYFEGQGQDQYTVRWRQAADLWRETCFLPDDVLIQQIEQDEIDILIDLMGHTGKRMTLFARKPAPMQVTWLGYVGTTGLSAMDYLLADGFHVRPGEENWYTEKVLRMRNGYACYGPPEDAPDVSALPALASGRITFGSFSNPAKFSPQILDAWCEVLRRTGDSRLLLKYGGLDKPSVQSGLWNQFRERGISEQRVLLEGWSPQTEFLSAYDRVDLALDTQPYSGGVTTCEALWMGVPVVTFPGNTFAGRHAASHMTNAGCPEFVADNMDGYVNLAVEWASRPEELADLRKGIRQGVRASPLCDAPRFQKDFLSVLRDAWEVAKVV